jgi:tRNA/tmRNA/rRNA uracil-C5-methylase (TrmA/RlmC/RlmD family)
MAGRIIEHIRTLIPDGARVAEFYAGVGAIGLSLLDRASELRLNELSSHSLAGLELGVAALGSADRSKVSVVAGSAAMAWGMADGADVVIADPPRKGLDAALIDALVERPPQRFVYVSCGLAALVKDIARLTANGALRLAALTAFNLFPFTEHVETVALFEAV